MRGKISEENKVKITNTIRKLQGCIGKIKEKDSEKENNYNNYNQRAETVVNSHQVISR